MRNDVWVECGRVGRPWGIRGEFFVDWFSGECPVQVGSGKVYIKRDGENYDAMLVKSSRKHGSRHVVGIEGIASRDEASGLRGATFFLPEDDLPELKGAEYYSYQLIGLTVVTEDGDEVGRVKKIFSVGEHDVYEVEGKRGGKTCDFLIPAVDHVVVNVDVEGKRIVIRKLEGLLE